MKRGMAVAGLIVVTAIWGGGFVASDIALNSLTPMQIMAIRFLLGAVLLSFISVREFRNINLKEIGAIWYIQYQMRLAFRGLTPE